MNEADGNPLCQLTLHGRFPHSMPHAIRALHRDRAEADVLVLTFHGRTGNLLLGQSRHTEGRD